ncbi:MAG: hypothetical protein KAV00_13130, partial [Phycisphaerae bacterium]|nr:hypothetical protein [Phycisphaerae bacterium]
MKERAKTMKYTIRLGVVLFLITGSAAVSLAELRVVERRGGRIHVIRSEPVMVGPTVSTQGGIHLPGGRSSGLPWVTTDSSGYRWDIAGNGTVSDGSNDAYDGGMQLQVNGTAFRSQPTAKLSADGKEIELGWRYNNLNISRRIFVNKKAGYCRWIDIFENTTSVKVDVSLRYYFNMGETTNRTRTTSGVATPTAGDWGIVTAGAANSSRPAIVHIFATPDAKFRPTFSFSRSNDSLYYNATIKVPANKAVALCFFEAQRRPYEKAVEFLKDFDPAAEMLLVPLPLRKIILNMTDGGTLTLGSLKLKRDKKVDLLILGNGNELRGRIINKEYVLRTDFGLLKIPADAVIGLSGRSRVHNRVHLAMTGGQIIAGELTSGPVAIKLSDGTELKIEAKGLALATYRISPEKPPKLTTTNSMAVFRTGARLAFEGTTAPLTFLTPYGTIDLSAKGLRSVEMDTPGGGLHRAIFRNGSTLAGLLKNDRIGLKLQLAPATLTEGKLTVEVSRRQLKRFFFTGKPVETKNQTWLIFRNTDKIFGDFVDKKLTIRGNLGDISVDSSKVAKAEFSAAAPGQVKLTLRDGTVLNGKLADDYIRFKIEPGPVLKIFTGHIKSITGAARPTTTNETPEPATPTTR